MNFTLILPQVNIRQVKINDKTEQRFRGGHDAIIKFKVKEINEVNVRNS